jgi:CBS domain-containing protein
MAVVAELMSRELVKVGPEITVAEAASVMAQRRVGSVLVMIGGRLHGIFTERDIVRALSNDIAAPREQISHWMTRDPLTIGSDADAEGAVRLMSERHFRHLPVVDGSGELAGMLSMRDLVRAGIATTT